MPYLLKSEPEKYSYDDLLRDGETLWDGIKNPQALITLRNMKRGENCIIYHSNEGKAAVGTAKVVSVELAPPEPPSKMTTPLVRLKAPVPPLGRPTHRRAVRLAPPRLRASPKNLSS
jgi:hypothetical protein